MKAQRLIFRVIISVSSKCVSNGINLILILQLTMLLSANYVNDNNVKRVTLINIHFGFNYDLGGTLYSFSVDAARTCVFLRQNRATATAEIATIYVAID